MLFYLKKSCNDEVIGDFFAKFSKSSADSLCFERKSKVIILLIDALKYEFGVYDENVTSPLAYQNKLPVIKQLMQQHPDNTRLLKFLADPPTTTLQRLKGMTTGSLPTFIDMGSNFATPELNEDNVIDQIAGNNMSAVFMGDSTWVELFPNRFKRKYSYPSFNIYDLDSVDNAILKHLPKEMEKTDWDILVAHFLGVDHCGHKHGPLHHEMARKLTEMNDVIKKVAETIDNDTMLIGKTLAKKRFENFNYFHRFLVMGDHGMTVEGDHGGSSEAEVEALLFAYSKNAPFVPTVYENGLKEMQQIDLSPTLATIMGVPVPFSSLGTVQLQLLPDVKVRNVSRHEVLKAHLWHNANQIKNYFTKYSEEHQETFSFEDLEAFENKFEVLEFRVGSLHSDDAFKSFAQDARSNLNSVLELCRNIWIKFNTELMAKGMILTLLGIFTAFILIFNVPLTEYPNVFSNKLVMFLLPTSFISAAVGYFFHQRIGNWEEPLLSALFTTSAWNILVFEFIVAQYWSVIADEMSSVKKLTNILPRITFMTTILVFFSNSFIVNEQKILSFLIAAQVVYAATQFRNEISDIKGKVKLISFLRSTFVTVFLGSVVAILVLLRLSHNYFKCREEQGNCWSEIANSESGKKDSLELFPPLYLIASVCFIRTFLKWNGNLTGYSKHVLVIKFGLMLGVIATCGQMILSQRHLASATKLMIPQIHLDAIAWVVYGVFAVALLVILVNPLMVHVVENSNQFSISNHEYAVPQLFNYMRKVFNQGSRTKGAKMPLVYGLATIYSSVFVAFGTVLMVLLSLLLGVKTMNGLLITVAMGIGILIIFSILRFESTQKTFDCVKPQFAVVVAWFVLLNYGFYATSHQPTISQIDWSPAFVGRAANFDHSSLVSGLLVLASTFSTHLLFHIIYPIIVLFPFMIYGLYPKLSINLRTLDKKSKEERTDYTKITLNGSDDKDRSPADFNAAHGEVFLYENESIFISSVFRVGCQLLILQGVKAMSSMIACTILARHLMVWKIFAPRFIYEGIASYISFVAIILGFALLLRVHSSVKKLIDKFYL